MEKINISELLKDCPKGMELDCVMFEKVTFVKVHMNRQFPIEIAVNGIRSKYLTKEGCFHDRTLLPEAKCVIFPKGKTTWEGFVSPIQFRDGDIAATDCNCSESQLFIVSGGDSQKQMKCYVSLFEDGKLDVDAGNYYVTRYATEEEKQKLFKAIKDNGYKWNPETKTLDKLIEPKFKVGDKVRRKNNHNVVFTITSIEEDTYVCGAKAAFWFADQDDYELVHNKFDITTLKLFDKVLVRDHDRARWDIHFYELYDSTNKSYPYCTLGGTVYKQCIPYEGNEHLIGLIKDCDDYYKTWINEENKFD